MANFGTNFNQDITLKVVSAATIETQASLWKLCAPNTAAGAADGVVDLPLTTTVNPYIVGAIQGVTGIGGANPCVRVRTLGVARLLCSNSVEAFHYVKHDSTGTIKQVTLGTEATFTTAAVVNIVIVGQALENGQTLQVIEVDMRPQLSTYNAS